jgi:citrate lyase subunit beta/citryl-CoA lyase
MLDKCASYGADAVIVDLEDSVPAAERPEARALTRVFVDAHADDDLVVFVRVNARDSADIARDLEAIVTPGLAGIQLPKVTSADDVRQVSAMLEQLEDERGLASSSVRMIVSLESALGVLHAYEILTAAPRVLSPLVGVAENGDLHRELGYEHTPNEEGSFHARAHVLLAARAAGVAYPIDGVYSRVENDDGFLASAQLARRLGYRGKKVIHPRQIDPANRVFAPSAAELDFHERVLEALAEAAGRGSAATTVDGLMVDTAMGETARKVLAWGRALRSSATSQPRKES